MLLSQSFNPYTYYETGQAEISTQVDSPYMLSRFGNYYDVQQLQKDYLFNSYYYANQE